MGCTVLGHIDGDDYRKALARIANLEAALRQLARACSTEFSTGEGEPDDANVFVGEIDGQGITYGLIRNALRVLGELD